MSRTRVNRQERLLFFDEATGFILDADGNIFDFDEYPDRPHVCADFGAAKARVRSFGDEGKFWYDLSMCNSEVIEE